MGDRGILGKGHVGARLLHTAVEGLIKIRRDKIITVDPAHPVPFGLAQAQVAGPALLVILGAVDDPHPVGIAGLVVPQHGQTVVGGRIVDKNQFHGLQRLGQQALDAVRQIGRYVVDRYDDGDKGVHLR